ncbi:hypothetical protein NL676_035932 [Syzygium grande]|nr:hypothetical protein NL676_035932 [Syzygium grande]
MGVKHVPRQESRGALVVVDVKTHPQELVAGAAHSSSPKGCSPLVARGVLAAHCRGLARRCGYSPLVATGCSPLVVARCLPLVARGGLAACRPRWARRLSPAVYSLMLANGFIVLCLQFCNAVAQYTRRELSSRKVLIF